MSWEALLWSELDALSDTEQFVTTGELISHVNQVILPRLADRRRDAVCRILGEEGWDPTRLAETVGARRGTILRLAQEGRSRLREKV
jgi:hypothetical protein